MISIVVLMVSVLLFAFFCWLAALIIKVVPIVFSSDPLDIAVVRKVASPANLALVGLGLSLSSCGIFAAWSWFRAQVVRAVVVTAISVLGFLSLYVWVLTRQM